MILIDLLHFLLRTIPILAGIGFLIFIHELGHFLVAKRMGVRVEKFSLGFGPTIFGFRKGDTEYVVSWIPLGGFVKMAGENPGDPTSGGPDEFTSKTVSQRAAIAVAGIAMNALTALVVFILAFKLGVRVIAPVVGGTEAGWPAWEAGVREGDRILQINDTPVRSFEDLTEEVALSEGPKVTLLVERQEGGVPTRKRIEVRRRNDSGIPQIGLRPPSSMRIESMMVSPTLPSPAQDKLEPGDTILGVAGEKVTSWKDLERRLSMRGRMETPLQIQRDGKVLTVSVTPRTAWTLGVEPSARIVVTGISQGYPAAATDLRKGDCIVSVDGVPMDTSEAFQRSVNQGPLHPLTLILQRADGSSASVHVQPMEDPREGKRLLGVQYAPEQPDHAVLANDIPMDKPAYASGLRGGDVIVAVGTKPISYWSQLTDALGEDKADNVTIQYRRGGKTDKAVLPFSPGDDPEKDLRDLGLKPAVIVGAVTPGSPAATLGITRGDRLHFLRLDHPPEGDPGMARSASTWPDMDNVIQIAGHLGAHLRLDWCHNAPGMTAPDERHNDMIGVTQAEPLFTAALPSYITLGVSPDLEHNTLTFPGILEPCREGLLRSKAEVFKIFRTVGRFFAPKKESLSPTVLGGPITIFLGANHFLDDGAGAFILFLGVISLNLAVLNLLPVPVLDGGLLLFLAIEKVRGAPLGEKAMAIAQYTGLALVLSLVIFVSYNDITLRLFTILKHYFSPG